MTATLRNLPDLMLVLRRDGTVQSWTGGDALPQLRRAFEAGSGWSEASQSLVRQLTRRCIAQRAAVESQLHEDGLDYEVRLTPQGPDRAICGIRPVLRKATDDTTDATDIRRYPGLDRRSFTRRLRDSLAQALLLERPLAVAVLQIEGLSDIAQTIGTRIADEVLREAMQRIPPDEEPTDVHTSYCIGQIGENLLAIVLEKADRTSVGKRIGSICAALGEPVEVAGVEFRLVCYAGAALLGMDNTTPTQLLDQASAAAMEARRANSRELRYHSETVRVRMLERLDLAKELREAVLKREIGFRFVPRHDLNTGRLDTLVAYLRWDHPLRGDIRPSEFLRIADSTGFGATLSRAVLRRLSEDFYQVAAKLPADVRVSFGALRDHVFDESFTEDVQQHLAESELPADRFEVRVAESTFVSRDLLELQHLRQLGVRLVVDEVGRNMSSLALMARARFWGLQVDRAWVNALPTDTVAASLCRATAGMAAACGLEAIAAGVDDKGKRDLLLEMGFHYGTGDYYRNQGSILRG